jgi:hypothetical protein
MHSKTGHWYRAMIFRVDLLMLGVLLCAHLSAQQQAILVDAPTPAIAVPQEPAASPIPRANPCPDPNGSTGSPGVHPADVPCTRKPLDWYQRFTNGPQDKPLTPRDKAWLAARNVVDPFNLITIGGDAGIAIGSDSHSAYGPGMPGFARYVGVSSTQDMIGEFFGTFALPSLAHQDPHYHRMPQARIPRRAWHAIAQVFWTQSDSGRMMPNYANLVGFGIDDVLSNLFVPGRETNGRASAERWGIGLATAPIGNVVSEFLPDIASHIHVQIVIVQRIINQVARTESGNTASVPAGDIAGRQ